MDSIFADEFPKSVLVERQKESRKKSFEVARSHVVV